MYHIAALYKFVEISTPETIKKALFPKMKELGISGSLICASEGINGTIAGSEQAITEIIALLKKYVGLSLEDVKFSTTSQDPFNRCKFKIKNEIVTLNKDGVNAARNTGEFVTPEQWNDILKNPDIVVLDTRNFYEVDIGTFKGAIDPKTDSFTDFPDYVEKNLNPDKNKQVAMFCTGGIRCEKASAYMKQQGFEKVYQLHGGILKYLEHVKEKDSLWEGDCFVFDDRVSVIHDLKRGQSEMCYACGYPVSKKEQKSPYYEEGVSCARCYNDFNDSRKDVFRERHARIKAERILRKPHDIQSA